MGRETSTTEQRTAIMAAPCPQCGGAVETAEHQHTFAYGAGDSATQITVVLPVRQCAECELEYLDHEGERIKHEALCRHLGVLTPDEIRHQRERHGLTRAEFAKLTGLGEASLNRWENGIVIQTVANDRYLRLLGLRDGLLRLRTLTRAAQTGAGEPVFPRKGTHPRRFAQLTVTDDVKQRQSTFQLRKAA